MLYEHHARITRAAGGTHDHSGAFVPGTPLVLYDGQADYQDGGRREVRQESGRPVRVALDNLFLEQEAAVHDIQPGDAVEIRRYGPDGAVAETITRTVASVTRLDGSLGLKA